jgi:hypothetical protein
MSTFDTLTYPQSAALIADLAEAARSRQPYTQLRLLQDLLAVAESLSDRANNLYDHLADIPDSALWDDEHTDTDEPVVAVAGASGIDLKETR